MYRNSAYIGVQEHSNHELLRKGNDVISAIGNREGEKGKTRESKAKKDNYSVPEKVHRKLSLEGLFGAMHQSPNFTQKRGQMNGM